MAVRWMAVLSVGGLLLIGPAGDLARAQSPPFDYFSVSPCRLLDTRLPGQGPALASGASRLVTVTGGSCGIPAIARAITANITSVASTGTGNLRLYAGDGTAPPTSALNFSAGQTRANNGIFPLAGNGNGTLAILATVAGSGTVHVVLDVTGYFAVPPCTTTCGGVCANLASDPLNCGACGVACASAQACSNGRCQCRPSLTLCFGSCKDLASEASSCGACGTVCGGGSPKCESGLCVAACSGGFDQCGNSCVNLNTDPLNCGACGLACTANEVCVSGNCQTFTVPVACNSCPCAECTGGQTCAAYPGDPGTIICVSGSVAP